MKTLILGGGWVGARLCLQNPSSYIVTSRSKDKLVELQSLGLEAIEFDLAREDTWSNLPSKELVSATVITFPVLAPQVSTLNKLLEKHIPVGVPLLCVGTASIFHVAEYNCVINESTPFTDKEHLSLSGESLLERAEGESWILSKGAAVLNLSGIVGNEKEEICYKKPRYVGSFMKYAQNGLKLVNLIHVNDICNIIKFFICKNEVVRGERVISSCGAFRWKDLAQGLGAPPLPELVPSKENMKGSKICSTDKLRSMLPQDYEWTMPVPGVKPVSKEDY